MRTRITMAAIAEARPASASRMRPTDSARDKVECVVESPAARLIEGMKALAIVSRFCG